MNFLSRLKLRTKLALLLGMSAVALVAAIGAGSTQMRKRMIEDRVGELRAVVQSATGFAQSLEKQVTAGQLTHEQALARFRADLHTMRFDGTNYVLVQTFDGLVVIHGGDPSREGKPTASKDANGTSSADLAREALRNADDAVISYLALKPGAAQPGAKLSYVARYAPWQMVFIAGDWTDDLDSAYRTSLVRLGSIGGGILVVTLLVALLINRDISGSLGKLMIAMERLANGDLSTDIPGTGRRDEIGTMAGQLLVFKDHMVKEQQLARAQTEERERAEAEKRAALVGMADRIEAETATALHEIAAARPP